MNITSSSARYGSDFIVDLLKGIGIEYVACNPGSTFRAIHESIVNYGGNRHPEIIECQHEEISVAIAHGYAKATGKPMVAMVHDTVGLLHASMAIFNAWCDRVPVLIMGGTGPMDVTKRRPWIDWIHTALVPGNAVRDFVKWDDQPGSVESFADSVIRGWRLAVTEPKGPVYICFECEHQEAELPPNLVLPDMTRYSPPPSPHPDPAQVKELAGWLVAADSPVVIADRMGRNPEAVKYLVLLAEMLALPVIDRGGCFNFPNHHPLDLTGAENELLTDADVVLALDVEDLFGATHTFRANSARNGETLCVPMLSKQTRVAHVSLKEQAARAWSNDYQRLTAVDLPIAADSATVLRELIPECRRLLSKADEGKSAKVRLRQGELRQKHEAIRARWRHEAEANRHNSPLTLACLADAVWEAIKDEEWVQVNDNSNGWTRRIWDFKKTGQYLGGSGGGGLGYGIGASVGVALAYRGTSTLCVDLQSDGDLLFSPQALWTAAHHDIPLLIVVNNNRSYFNSENHQQSLSKQRDRPLETAGIGTTIERPPVDIAGLARSLGVHAEGPFNSYSETIAAVRRAVEVVKKEKRSALVDVLTRKESR